MPTLGIIGGIAPGSTVDYYQQIVERYRIARPDGGYPAIVINSIDLTHFIALVGSGDRDALVEYLLTELGRLARAGVDVALFASNTPHLVFDAVAARSPIPLLSIVEATAIAAQAQGLRHVGLLGTRFTMDGGFYRDVFRRHGVTVTVPPAADRDLVHSRYFAEFVHGDFRPETRRELLAVIERMRVEAGIDGVILGGTELPPLFRDGEVPSVPMLDTTRIHVAAAVAALVYQPPAENR